MAARNSRKLSKMIAFWTFTLIIAVSVEKSQQSVSTECVRKCNPQQLKRLTRKVSKLFSSCYHQCLGVRRAAHGQAPVRPGIFQKRFRKALPPNPNCPGSSPNQTQDWKPSNINVTFGQYENTTNWYANLSWTPMNDANESWTSILIRFFAIDTSTGDVDCLKYPKNQSVATVNITSYGYQYPNKIYLDVIGQPFSSDDTVTLGTYGPVVVSSTVTSVAQTTPTAQTTPATETETSPATNTQTPPTTDKGKSDNTTTLITIVAVSLGVLGGLTFAACLLKNILSRRPKSSKLPPEFKYHAFIIYSSEDKSWVTGELLPFLEEESHLKCCVHYRDFMPGKPFEVNMAESVYNSYKVIAVFSKNLVLSNYCIHELDLAKHRLLKERDDSLVVMRIDKTDCEMLPRGLKKRSFIDYANPLEKPFWKSKLIKFLDTSKDLVEESRNEDKDNNNCFPNDFIEENQQRRTTYERTISTATEVSVISETEGTSV